MIEYKNFKIQNSLLKYRFRSIGKIIVPAKTIKKTTEKHSKIAFCIDQIGGTNLDFKTKNVIIHGYDNFLIINGWAIDEENNCLPKDVWIDINGISYKCKIKLPRPDIVNATANYEFLLSGFQLKLPRIFVGEGNHNLSLYVVSKKNYRVKAKQLNIIVKSYPKNRYPIHTISGKKQEKDEIIEHLYQQLTIKDQIISNLYNSLSWKLSSPFRFIIDIQIKLKNLFSKENFIPLAKIYNDAGFKGIVKIIWSILKLKVFKKQEINYLISENNYSDYIKFNQLKKEDIYIIKKEIKNFDYKPLISIVTPVYNVEPKWLDLCFKSIKNQLYTNWEFCLHDDASTRTETINCLRRWEKNDKRIKISYGKSNQHISGASNQAIKLASGEFIGFLDNDDEISPDALFEVVKQLNIDPSLEFIYSDEDKLELNGIRSQPYFKSDFNLDLFLSNNYICHFSVIKKEIGDKINWFRKGYEGSQDYDLFLRAVEQTNKIYHIPKVLYHWRKIPGSTAVVYSDKSYANESSLNALSDYIKRNKLSATVENGLWPGAFRIKYNIKENNFVSILIPFKDEINFLKDCVSSILQKTVYSNYEIILINNNSKQKETLEYLNKLDNKEKIRILNFEEPFNFSKINNWAAKRAKGNILLFLNNDTVVINKDWLANMVEHIQRKEVGAVGAKLLYSNDLIQHAGVILGVGGVANHAFSNFHHSDNFYYGNSNVVRNYTACSAACLMVEKSVYNKINGMDEDLKIAYNDIDLCMKIRKLGLLVTYTPYAQLYHYESQTRGYDLSLEKKTRLKLEEEILFKKWGNKLKNDPYYNRNLNDKKVDYSIKIDSN